MLSLSKVRNVRSWEMFEMEFKFSKLVKIIVLRRQKTVSCSEYSIRFVLLTRCAGILNKFHEQTSIYQKNEKKKS